MQLWPLQYFFFDKNSDGVFPKCIFFIRRVIFERKFLRYPIAVSNCEKNKMKGINEMRQNFVIRESTISASR